MDPKPKYQSLDKYLTWQQPNQLTKTINNNTNNSKSISKTSLLSFVWLYSLLMVLPTIMADCPSTCECKWKSGKESVLCLNANLTHIPSRLDSGTQVLDLTGNDIPTIPNDVFADATLLNLQKVHMPRCRIRHIETYAFRKLSNLVELDLSYNQLTMVPSASFESIPELRDIKLNGNPIQRIANDAFSRIPQLVRLDISDCRIQVIEKRGFLGLEASLEWLKLDGNQLVNIHSDTITSLSNLHGLELARNNWNCSCQLRPLRSWMLRENIPYSIPPTCSSPQRLAGKTWDRIDLDEFACSPHIQTVDMKTNGVEGRNVTMSCYVDGVPDPNIRWFVKNRVIANLTGAGELVARPLTSSSSASSAQSRKSYVVNFIRNSSNLTILQVEMQDAGVYTCSAENKAGRAEASMTLAVSRKPPEAPLTAKIILLCITIALLFVIGSSVVAICFCSVRKRGKMKIWKSGSTPGSDSYEKIEMKRTKPDGSGIGGGGGGAGAGCVGGILRAHSREYMENGGIAIVNTTSCTNSSSILKRNGDYRTVPTDDDGTGYEDNSETTNISVHRTNLPSSHQLSAKSEYATTAATALIGGADGRGLPKSDKSDLHIGRLIDLANPAIINLMSRRKRRLRAFLSRMRFRVSSDPPLTKHLPPLKLGYATLTKTTWSSQLVTTTNQSTILENKYEQIKNDVNSSVFCTTNHPEMADQQKYPDLLDISKYSDFKGGKSSSSHNGGLCTLPRKLKNTGKYFKNSTDSQSPLLAECSSKYGSSLLGDQTSLSDLSACGRRLSVESYNNPGGGYYGITHRSQRSNSFLNLVQTVKPTVHRKNPSLPSSPVREAASGSHQRSFSSAATPLLDFSSLINTRGGIAIQQPSKINAYDYHAAQLQRFLEEYRNLQEQLCKMKETCDSIRKKEGPQAPLRGALGHSAQFADPVMFDAAMNSNSLVSLDAHSNPKSLMKSKSVLPGQPPDPPPYWLHRSNVLKRLNESHGDYFKS